MWCPNTEKKEKNILGKTLIQQRNEWTTAGEADKTEQL